MLGVVVAGVSLYQMSLTGTMRKLGLYGADFSEAVSSEKLSNWEAELGRGSGCGILNKASGLVGLGLARGDERGRRLFGLGERRIECGVEMMRRGRVEEGTYEVTKGIGYLSSGYDYLLEKVTRDVSGCGELLEMKSSRVVELLLTSTSGKVYELLYDEWSKVETKMARMEEMCLDEANSRR